MPYWESSNHDGFIHKRAEDNWLSEIALKIEDAPNPNPNLNYVGEDRMYNTVPYAMYAIN